MASGNDASLAAFLLEQNLNNEERSGRGRCLVAQRTFLPGELIFSQVGLVLVDLLQLSL